MGTSRRKVGERPRELRRRVVLPARLRTGARWSDTCIVNISSRGLMIHSGFAAPKGSVVELRRGEHVIVAQVVWRDGGRVGLRSEERLPIEEIVSLGRSQALRFTAEGAPVERRKHPRPSQVDSRLFGRAMEFAAILGIGGSLAIGVWSMAEQSLARPMAIAAEALGNDPQPTFSR